MVALQHPEIVTDEQPQRAIVSTRKLFVTNYSVIVPREPIGL